MFNYALSERHYRPLPMLQRHIIDTAKMCSFTLRLAEQKVQCSSSVGVVTRPRAGNQQTAVRLPSGSCCFYIVHRPCRLCAILPTVQWLQTALRSGREADHMSLSGAEFKNDWMCTSISPYALMPCTDATFIYANKI